MPEAARHNGNLPADLSAAGSLVSRCLEGGWLAGGSSPAMPHARVIATLPDLLGRLCETAGAQRAGMVHGDLAFIPQDGSSDGWWVLKRARPGEWTPFENCAFRAMGEDPHRLNDTVVGMLAASARECAELGYSLPTLDIPWNYGRSSEGALLTSRFGRLSVEAASGCGSDGASLALKRLDTGDAVFESKGYASVVEAAKHAADACAAIVRSASVQSIALSAADRTEHKRRSPRERS